LSALPVQQLLSLNPILHQSQANRQAHRNQQEAYKNQAGAAATEETEKNVWTTEPTGGDISFNKNRQGPFPQNRTTVNYFPNNSFGNREISPSLTA
jgi:hypothetical protein